MDEAELRSALDVAVATLRAGGARFGYLHGSRGGGDPRAESDIDVAASFGARAPQQFEIPMPPRVDLLILEHAPLELAGRIALSGRLLFEDDQVARIRWEAQTRKIYLDELPRIQRSHREFAASVRRG